MTDELTKEAIEQNRVARRVLRCAFRLDAEKRLRLNAGVDPIFADTDPRLVEAAGSEAAAVAAVKLLMGLHLVAARTLAEFSVTDSGRGVAPSLDELATVLPLDVATEHYEQNEAARLLLKILHATAVRNADKKWMLDDDIAEANGLPVGMFKVAANRLADLNLARRVAQGAYTSTPEGQQLALNDDEEELDRLLPVQPRPRPPSTPITVGAAATARGTADASDAVAKARIAATDLLEDGDLRAIALRDLAELDGALEHRLPKAAMLLAGGLVELMLVDVLDRNRGTAGSYLKGNKKFPDDASLEKLVEIAIDQRIVERDAESMVLRVKDFRDCIHAQAERREKLKVDETTVKVACLLLELVARDLVEAKKNGTIDTYVNGPAVVVPPAAPPVVPPAPVAPSPSTGRTT